MIRYVCVLHIELLLWYIYIFFNFSNNMNLSKMLQRDAFLVKCASHRVTNRRACPEGTPVPKYCGTFGPESRETWNTHDVQVRSNWVHWSAWFFFPHTPATFCAVDSDRVPCLMTTRGYSPVRVLLTMVLGAPLHGQPLVYFPDKPLNSATLFHYRTQLPCQVLGEEQTCT